jgi:hypothetical protein
MHSIVKRKVVTKREVAPTYELQEMNNRSTYDNPYLFGSIELSTV